MSNARIDAAAPPYTAEVQAFLDRMMPPGMPPLVLFTTLARDPRLFERFTRGGLLDRGHLSLRQRELVIDRVTARCGSEYEWGVHVTAFGPRIGLTDAERVSLVRGGPDDACWSAEERTLLRLCDSLHESCDVPDALWAELRAAYPEEAVLELLMLAGFYRTVAYLTNSLRLPLEPHAARFPGA
jgi:alkylhydroperoxidase family enzyme